MAKLTLADIVNLQNETTVVNTINNNGALVEAAIEDTLSRSGTSPNEMNSNLDMNANRILNLPLPNADTEPIRKGEFDDFVDDVELILPGAEAARDAALAAQAAAEAAQSAAESAQADAEIAETNAETAETNAAASAAAALISENNAATSESNAATSESNASTSASTATTQAGIATTQAGIATTQAGNASTSATNANNSAIAAAASAQDAEDALDEIGDIYLGSKTSNPILDNDGDPLVTGQLYWNSVASNLRIYDGASWNVYSASSGLTAVVDDTNPALGGNLDLNSNDITGTGNIDITGTIEQGGNAVLDAADIGTTVQGYDADLDAWAAVNPSSYLTTSAAAAAYQPLDSDLTSWAGVTRAAGFDTFTATPSSANLASLVTNETGSGALVFATSPTLVTPVLGTPTSGTLTNCTGLPAAGVTNTALVVSAEDQGPITGGARITPKDLGTQSSGTLTPDPGDRPMQYYTNNGAHTLGELSQEGYTWLLITNGASAGAITTSGWDLVEGDAFTTTNGHRFECAARKWGTYSILTVRALQ